ncbi:TadG family pilus assembly protein [Burkholderia thailandensis]|uniref:TadG family pilus assembly protein n=1 Tax=Burkholderia thailandensis TaxID=57975 RepID=UPI00140C2702|nr:TadG family pilus assembly protein [Burkholderia thailandensis]MCS3395664.1 pilus assembly protein TadG-related protein [Burkholderia thailandensis]QIO11909.1 pilus assembly protein TadE [Burkholderia thailandensis]
MNERRAAAAACHRERGSVVLWFLLFLPVLLLFGAFAIDLPRVATARNELQNAADAAALAGAASLESSAGAPVWAAAASAASAALSLNASDGATLASGVVQTGYWNVTGAPAGLEPTTLAPGAYDVPAVQTTVTRATNQNGGPLSLLMGGFLGILGTPAAATAVAVAAAPSTVGAGGLFPMVIDQCVLDQYWDAQAGAPRVDPTTGAPYEFQVGNGQTYGGTCYAGQWTTFLVNANDVPTVRGLMANGNPTPLSIGDSIWIEPGVKTALYYDVPVGVTVVVPVATQISSKTYVPIVAFAAFYVDASDGANIKAITGHFVGGYRIPVSAGGVGPAYGAYVAPRLAN